MKINIIFFLIIYCKFIVYIYELDKSMEIIAETMKLIGNSLYGRCVMNKEKHVGMTYANDSNITKKN